MGVSKVSAPAAAHRRQFFAGSTREASDLICRRASQGTGGYACFCNVHVLMEADATAAVDDALSRAWMVFPDGAPVAWLLRRNVPAAQRVAGPDVFEAVLRDGRARGLRHYFFGASERVLFALTERVAERYPGIEIVGYASPPF